MKKKGLDALTKEIDEIAAKKEFLDMSRAVVPGSRSTGRKLGDFGKAVLTCKDRLERKRDAMCEELIAARKDKYSKPNPVTERMFMRISNQIDLLARAIAYLWIFFCEFIAEQFGLEQGRWYIGQNYEVFMV